ncbi:MAG: hypothetical protein KZQ96_01880 [Candidatus Thiodiazotropha sp. (ex Lucinoma borealis)]|nr:hypothetical protein [Candidatus Thiodiazotropha sp. (ex Lucinoma borealis)]MCU7869353.1 hypothetical protein [Candidatus Thiodiazotropha sp. (ex Lucinoma borealis)]
MRFSCIGFDLREWPWNGSFNADDTGWDTNEARYSEIVERYSLSVNEYQLIDIQNQELLDKICEWVMEKEDCNLIAIQFPQDAVKLLDHKLGYSTSSINLDLSRFVCRGLDVCDFNGLFSALHDTRLVNSSKLIPESNLLTALEITQFANVLDRNHCPFVVAKIFTLK